MLVLLASPRWHWCPGEYLLVPYDFRLCMKPANIRQDTSAIWEKPIKPTYRAHHFGKVSTPLRRKTINYDDVTCIARRMVHTIRAKVMGFAAQLAWQCILETRNLF